MYKNLEVIDNASAKQYEAHIEDSIARIEYIRAKNRIYLTHTEVPNSLAGKGIGSALVLKVLEDIERQDLILVPLCPFVALYLTRHTEWKKLVMKGINID